VLGNVGSAARYVLAYQATCHTMSRFNLDLVALLRCMELCTRATSMLTCALHLQRFACPFLFVPRTSHRRTAERFFLFPATEYVVEDT
jgi:hypothetical protein